MTLGLAGCLGLLLVPRPANADEPLEWARIDFLRNRVQFVPREQRARRARIADVLSTGDALRTARSSRAELRFSDGSLARIGERATFRFTPNTRNFQLTNGTVLLLIPPERGRSTIQTPNAVTGIQGSALFVRYIPETDTTIVGALTNNPDGPMVLFNRDGTEQQALRANEIGVIQGDQITQLYQFDGELFWQSSGLAEGFNYLNDSSSTGSDALDAVRQEIREAIADQRPLDGEGVIENPGSFSRPLADEAPETPVDASIGEDPTIDSGEFEDDFPDAELEEDAPLEFKDSPAAEYLNSANPEPEDRNSLEPAVRLDAVEGEDAAEVSTDGSEDVLVDETVEDEDVVTQAESETLIQDDKPTVVPAREGEEAADVTDDAETPAVVASPTTVDPVVAPPNVTPTAIMDSDEPAGDESVSLDANDGTVPDGVDAGGVDAGGVGAGDGTDGVDAGDVDAGGEVSPDIDPPATGELPGEGTDQIDGQIDDQIDGEISGGEIVEPPGEALGDVPDDTDGLILPDTDGLVLPEEDTVLPLESPVDNDVVPIVIPDEAAMPETGGSDGVEGVFDAGIQQELIEITTPDAGGVDADIPPINDVIEVPNDVIEVPNDVPDSDVIGVDVTDSIIPAEVTTPLEGIETPLGGLSTEPLPPEIDALNVPLVLPMDEMMNESMGGSGNSMGNGMNDMNDMTDTPDVGGEGTPDAGNSMPTIPGTVTVPSTNTPPDNTPPENTPPENTPPENVTDTPDTSTPEGSETPEAPEVPRGTV